MVGNGLHGMDFIVPELKKLLMENGIGQCWGDGGTGVGEMVGIYGEYPF